MRVDRGGGKGFINESSRPGKESVVQKKGAKKKEEPAEDKDASSSIQNESKIDPGVVSGRKEESELTAKITRQFLSAELPAQSAGEQEPAIQQKPPTKKEEFPSRSFPNELKGDSTGVSGQKEESAFTGKMTRQFLSAELPKLSEVEQHPDDSLPVSQASPELQISSNLPFEVTRLKPDTPPEPTFPTTRTLESMDAEQKAAVVKNTLDQPVASDSGAMIHAILMSSGNSEEFNRIIESAGGKNILNALVDKEMKVQWDRLAGAYDRIDLAINPQEAIKTRSLLTGEHPELRKLLPESDQPLLLQTGGDNGPVDLSSLSRTSTVCVALENAVRVQDGLPLISPGELREKVFDLLNAPDQHAEKRAELLDGLREEFNLTQYQMREIVSLPMAETFQSVIKDLTGFRDQKLQTLDEQIEKAILTDGPDSIVTEIAQAEKSEFLENIETEINLFTGLHRAASEIFSGPADPLVKIDSVVHRVLNDFMPPPQKLNSFVETLEKGSQVFEPGKLDLSLHKIHQLQIPELKNFVAQGVSFFDNLSKLAPDIQVLAPELKPFQFLSHLYNGLFHRQITEFKHAILEYGALPHIQQSAKEMDQWRKDFALIKSMPNRRSVIAESARKMFDGLTQDALMTRWTELRNQTEDLDLPAQVDRMIDSVRTMGDLVVSFRNGHFVQILGALNHRMAGSPAILQIIQQALHLTNSGAGFLRGLFSREWERPITLALKKNPGSKELTEAQSMFSDALNLFLPLESIDNLNPFLQYQKQLGLLRDESLMRDRIHRHLDSLERS